MKPLTIRSIWEFLSVPRLYGRITELERDVEFLQDERKRIKVVADQTARSFSELAAVKFAYEAANAQLQKELSELRMEMRKSEGEEA